MGASGKVPAGHGSSRKASSARPSNRDGGYGPPLHPLRVRTGQQYWPLLGKRRRTLLVTRVLGDGTVHARRLDGARERLRLKTTRLLAVDARGLGRFYRFQRFSPRRYDTWAIVLDLDFADGRALLCCPEWHPSRPVTLPARLLPLGAGPGQWLSCTADLSAVCGAQLNVANLACCPDPGEATCHRPRLRQPFGADQFEQRQRRGRGRMVLA